MSCTISRNIAKEAKMMIPPFTMNDSGSGMGKVTFAATYEADFGFRREPGEDSEPTYSGGSVISNIFSFSFHVAGNMVRLGALQPMWLKNDFALRLPE
jgi:hypothetical protein